MPLKEGVIKFKLHWRKAEPPSFNLGKFNRHRKEVRDLGLIGEDNGVGYGNISERIAGGFIISGTQTGHLKELTGNDLALVTAYDWEANELWAEGMAKPSSESMTHGAVYASHPGIKAIVHGHDIKLWEHGLRYWKHTKASIPYGTPQIAEAVKQIVEERGTSGVLAMAGHEGGVLSWGESIEKATLILSKEIELAR